MAATVCDICKNVDHLQKTHLCFICQTNMCFECVNLMENIKREVFDQMPFWTCWMCRYGKKIVREKNELEQNSKSSDSSYKNECSPKNNYDTFFWNLDSSWTSSNKDDTSFCNLDSTWLCQCLSNEPTTVSKDEKSDILSEEYYNLLTPEEMDRELKKMIADFVGQSLETEKGQATDWEKIADNLSFLTSTIKTDEDKLDDLENTEVSTKSDDGNKTDKPKQMLENDNREDSLAALAPCDQAPQQVVAEPQDTTSYNKKPNKKKSAPKKLRNFLSATVKKLHPVVNTPVDCLTAIVEKLHPVVTNPVVSSIGQHLLGANFPASLAFQALIAIKQQILPSNVTKDDPPISQSNTPRAQKVPFEESLTLPSATTSWEFIDCDTENEDNEIFHGKSDIEDAPSANKKGDDLPFSKKAKMDQHLEALQAFKATTNQASDTTMEDRILSLERKLKCLLKICEDMDNTK